MWKEAVVAALEVLSQPVTKGNEKNHAKEIEDIFRVIKLRRMR
jgi:hypothetical protein